MGGGALMISNLARFQSDGTASMAMKRLISAPAVPHITYCGVSLSVRHRISSTSRERSRKYMHTLSLCTTPTLVGDVIFCSCLATAMVASGCISAQRSAMPSAEAGKQVVIQSKRLQAARLGFDLHMRGHLGRAMIMMS